MRRKFLGRCVKAGVLIGAMGTVEAVARNHADIQAELLQRIRELLAAYSANQPDRVLALLDPGGWTIFGSDIAEIVRTEAGLRELMRADFRLWQTASFGPLKDVDIKSDGDFACAILHVDFSAGGGPAVPVRFCMSWRRVRSAWMLSQCASTVPTVHASVIDPA